MSARDSRPRPPDYGSRSMQFRLLLMVGLLMLVLVGMDEARKPHNWAWMGFEEFRRPVAPNDSGATPGEASERLVDLFEPTPSAATLFDAMAAETRSDLSEDELPQVETDEQVEEDDSSSVALRGTLLRFLELVFVTFDNDERQLLTTELTALANDHRTSTEDVEARTRLAGRLRQVAAAIDHRLRTEAQRAIAAGQEPSAEAADIGGSISTPWDGLLDQATGRLGLVAEAIAEGTIPERATLGDLQQLQELVPLWDRVLLDQVADLTVGHHPDEQHAWFRVVERIAEWRDKGVPPAVVPVTLYELDRQPDRYRGKWVRVTGKIRRVVREPVPDDRLDSAPPWTLWVRPDSGPEGLICIAVRRLPEGFPRPDGDVTSVDIDQPATIDGVFFKRMGYVSGMGTLVAPQLVADQPLWTRPLSASDSEPIGLGSILAIAVGCVAAAVLIAVRIERMVRRPRTFEQERRTADEDRTLQDLKALAGRFERPTIGPPSSPSPERSHEPPSEPTSDTNSPTTRDSESGSLRFPRSGLSIIALAVSLAAASIGPSSSLGQQPPLPPWLTRDEARSSDERTKPLEPFADLPRSELARLGDGTILRTGEPIVLEMIGRLERLGPLALRRSAEVWNEGLRRTWTTSPGDHRTELATIAGELVALEVLELDELTADRFDRDEVYRLVIACERHRLDDVDGVTPDPAVVSDHRVVAWVGSIPASWLERVPIGDRIEVVGALLHLEPATETDTVSVPLVLAAAPRWYPSDAAHAVDATWYPLGLDASVWDAARRTEGEELRPADAPGLYRLIAAVRDEPPAALPAAEPFELFDLLGAPEAWHGRIVRLRGAIERITEIGTGNDQYAIDAGIERYYQIDLLVALDGRKVRIGSEHPDAVVSNRYPLTLCVAELPPGLSTGSDLNLPIEAQGVFYRNWRYRSEYLRRISPELRQVAPLLVATALTPAPTAAVGQAMLNRVAIAIFATAAAATAIGILWLRWSDRKYLERRREAKRQSLPERIDLGS